MYDPSDVSMGAPHLAPSRANFPFLDDSQSAILEKMEAVNGTTAVGELLRKSPDAIVARIACFREYEVALENHVTDVVTAKGPPVSGGGELMDLGTIDLSGVDLSNYDLSAIDVRALHIKCFACGRLGHFQRNCPRNGGSESGFQARRGRFRWCGRGRNAGFRKDGSDASQGNADSQ